MHNPIQPIPIPGQIKVYAITTLNTRTETLRFNLTVNDVSPVFEPAPVCPFFPGDSTIKCFVGDQRTIPVGSTVDLRGRIYDVAGATHSVNLLWGDGTSLLHPAGCTSTGCPGFATPWFGATPPPAGSLPSKFVGFTHVYETLGTHPLTLVVDDGAPDGDGDKVPDGEVTYTSEMKVFGITAPAGPTEVKAGEAIPYTFSSLGPDGSSPAPVTPTCEGGSAGNITASSFTCLFGDVGADTPRKVKLQSVIGGYPFERTLDVTVKVRATTISPLNGPTSVIAGTEHTYTFTESHSTVGGITFFIPVVWRTRHHPVLGWFEPQVQVRQRGAAGDQRGLHEHRCTRRDGDVVARCHGAAGCRATATLAAAEYRRKLDEQFRPRGQLYRNRHRCRIRIGGGDCAPQSGTQFPIGTTTVSMLRGRLDPNVATGTFTVTIVDATPPTLSLPQPFALDATVHPAPSRPIRRPRRTLRDCSRRLQCTPVSGSTFPIGTTTVACTAKDSVGQHGPGSVRDHRAGASDQVAALRPICRLNQWTRR